MAITITAATNEQLYADVKAVARQLRDIKNSCTVLAERLYFIGIPTDPANGGEVAVTGFADADNLAKADVAAGIGLVLDARDFVTSGRVQVIAQLLRNELA